MCWMPLTSSLNREYRVNAMNNEQDVVRPDPRLLEMLVCPLTRGPLRYDAQALELISDKAGLAFPIRNGIPIMLIEEARSIES